MSLKRFASIFILSPLMGSLNSCAGRPAQVAQHDLKSFSVDNAAAHTCKCGQAIQVQAIRSNGFVQVAVSYNEATSRFEFERDATFFFLPDAEGSIVVHERMASDTDRLVILQPADKASQTKIDHNDDNDYVHEHYRILSGGGNVIHGVEYQYAGSDEPRQRDFQLTLDQGKTDFKLSSWQPMTSYR